jgi:HAD superfamily hydrolase (TIGR01484 family)
VLPTVVACDLDGTLLRSDGTLSERTQRALAVCEASGALIVLCTARPVRWVRPMAEQIGGRAVAVCANGGVVWNLQADELLAQSPLAPEVAATVVSALRNVFPGAAWAVERIDGFGHEPAYTPRWPVPENTVIADIDELLGQPLVKLMVRHEQLAPDEMLPRGRIAVGALAELTHSNSADGLLEISAAGVNKGSGLALVCETRSLVARDVIAFGDMPNDLPMLEWAGRAVAVANAHPDVHASADETTASNDEDGVAQVLERIWAAVESG